MSYEEEYENHPVHTVMAQFDSAINVEGKNKLDQTALDNLDRLRQASAFLATRLERASPTLTSAAKLTQLQKHVQASLNEVNQFNSNGNSGHLTNAANQIEAAVNVATTLVKLDQSGDGVKAKDVVSFKKLAEAVIADLRNEAGTVSAGLHALEEAIRALGQQAAQQKAQLEALDSTSQAKLQELDSRFQAEQADRKTEFDAQVQATNEQAAETFTEFSQGAEEHMKQLVKKKEEAERLVSLIGNIGLTGNFKGAAAAERKAADQLRLVALACFLGMVAVVAVTLFITVANGFDPWLALFRLGAGLTLIVPAAYAARESSRHRTLANRNQRAELELASIDAYLESLPIEKRAEMKAGLTDKFFGQIGEQEENGADTVPAGSLVGLLKAAIQELGKR